MIDLGWNDVSSFCLSIVFDPHIRILPHLCHCYIRRVFGHAATPEGVAALKASVRLNPGMGSPEVRVVVPASEFSPMGFPEPASGGSEPKKRAYDIVDRD